METAYNSRLERVNHLLCCSMKIQTKSYLKVHWRRCQIAVMLRKISKTLFFVGGEIAQCFQESSEREEFYPYPSNFTLENLSALIPKKFSYFLDAIFTKSQTSTAQEKKNLQKVTIAHVIMQCWGIPVTTSTCFQFVRASNHKITCSGWCSIRIGTFVVILGYIRFRKMCECICDWIHWLFFTVWRWVDGMLLSVHSR